MLQPFDAALLRHPAIRHRLNVEKTRVEKTQKPGILKGLRSWQKEFGFRPIRQRQKV